MRRRREELHSLRRCRENLLSLRRRHEKLLSLRRRHEKLLSLWERSAEGRVRAKADGRLMGQCVGGRLGAPGPLWVLADPSPPVGEKLYAAAPGALDSKLQSEMWAHRVQPPIRT
jgi:hypothetical protein